MMRVITGSARGKRLLTPRGDTTRPTSEKVKESIFSIIQFEIEGTRCLDLFCGTGQMGIEALSRGAAECVFIDKDRAAAELTEKNVAACGFSDRAAVQRADVLSALARFPKGRFDLIFLDPPYGGLLNDALAAVERFDILSNHGIIICESAAGDAVRTPAEPYAFVREYRYGQTKVTRLTREIT